MPANAGLAALRREFGNQGLEEDVLASVLEMFQGNVQETIQFLRAGTGDYVEDPNAKGEAKLPKDYLKSPAGWSLATVQDTQKKASPVDVMRQLFLSESPFKTDRKS